MMKEPISLDTALQIVGSLKVRAINDIDETNNAYYSPLIKQMNGVL